MAIKLNTGKVAFLIEFDNGDNQNIYFNPNDPDLATRLIASKDKIQKRIEEMKSDDVDLQNNGEMAEVYSMKDLENLSEEQREQIIQKAECISKVVVETKKIIFEELNTAFGSDISSVVFKYCSPFAVVDGSYFIMNFLEAMVPEIKKITEKTNAETERKFGKHMNKYMKR